MQAKAVVASASFKGTLTSRQAGTALAQGLREAGIAAEVVALADGGEGLVEAFLRAVPGATRSRVRCRGPLGERRSAVFATLPAGPGRHVRTAVIEMAASSGLPLLPPRKRDPRFTTTYGVGEQIRAALDRGARAILLGIGGSATNDGGAGMAQALGIRLLDRHGRELPPGGAALLDLERIDMRGLDPRLRKVRLTVACDVENPLCGRHGASAVFGPQKGASPADVKLLDRALARFARVVARDLGKRIRQVKGAGAAGGLGAGCLAFLNARLAPGIELVLDALGFGAKLAQAALVVTGEGRLDRQTLMGKAPYGVAERAKRAGVPCVAVGGSVETTALRRLRNAFLAVEDLSVFAGGPDQARRRGAYWLKRLACAKGNDWMLQAARKNPRRGVK